ncbi:Protein TOC75-3 [Forsythia ovata]|uniref:Protein TOC75-3 n=1 Tax=Forsythia ovata TaxID=205694 RepID=A0ABD1T968_9LAMI
MDPGGGGKENGRQGGDFWSRIFSSAAIAKDDEPQQEWDNHGLLDNIFVVHLNKLSGFKKYKVSDILFLGRRRGSSVGTEDSSFEMVSLRPSGIYIKAQLQKELETLATCGMFEKVNLKTKTNPDGTINITIPFQESTWQSTNRFMCINAGLM